MLVKNTASQGVYLYAYNAATGLPKTGDAANITGVISKDGAADAATATANPTEIAVGRYWQPLSQAETNANVISIGWASSTASIQIQPLTVLTDRGGVNIATNQLAIKKNAALTAFTFPIMDPADHLTPKTGLTVAGTVSIDGAAAASLTNAISEIGSSGLYKVNLAAADTNGNVLAIKFTASGGDTRIFTILTQA